jgi:hypothetical protein
MPVNIISGDTFFGQFIKRADSKLEDPEERYSSWRARFLDAVVADDIERYLKHADPPEGTSEADRVKWRRDQKQLATGLRMTLGDGVRGGAREEMAVKELWDDLEETYHVQGTAAVVRGLHGVTNFVPTSDFRASAKDFGDCVSAYEIAVAAAGRPEDSLMKNPKMVANLFLAKTGESYRSFKTGFLAQNREPTWKTLREALLVEAEANQPTLVNHETLLRVATPADKCNLCHAEGHFAQHCSNPQIRAILDAVRAGSSPSAFLATTPSPPHPLPPAATSHSQPKVTYCSHCITANRRSVVHPPEKCWLLHPELNPNQAGGAGPKRRQQANAATVAQRGQDGFFVYQTSAAIETLLRASPVSSLSEWICDSGCSSHVSNDKLDFVPGSLKSTDDSIELATGTFVKITGVGQAPIRTVVDGVTYVTLLDRVLFVPEAGKKLFSQGAATGRPGGNLRERGQYLEITRNGIPWVRFKRRGHLFVGEIECGAKIMKGV